MEYSLLHRINQPLEASMLSFDALVQGRVTYEGAQGPPSRIPLGWCTAQAHEGFVSLSWTEGGEERAAVLSVQQFEDHLEAGSIVIVEAPPLRPRRAPISRSSTD
ncbi:hypothetical protein [Methylibium sp.]|uniref:hypothetical protein n=1 Tax=Methylibium sp. TaxID=2067992 RepID=UPI003D12CBE2